VKKLLVIIFVYLLLLSPALAKYSGGSGTEADPYLIATAADMNSIGANSEDWSSFLKLVSDINLAEYNDTTRYKMASNFNGTFDGQNHLISNLTYLANDDNYRGLFGSIGTTGKVFNVRMQNVNIYLSSTGGVMSGLVGAIAGENKGIIFQCSSTGKVEGSYAVGGLVGKNTGTISQCFSTAEIKGELNVGGLVGYNSSYIDNCYSKGDVSRSNTIGGFVGFNSGIIYNCYTTGYASGNFDVGQFVGDNTGSITHCFDRNSVTKNESTYLNVGWDFVNETANGTDDIWIIDEGVSYPLIMFFSTFVPNVTGMTEAQANAIITDTNLIIGTVTTAYSNTVPEGCIMEQMPPANTLVISGSAVDIVISLGSKYSGGSGTTEAPYLIETPAHLIAIGATSADWSKCFKLVADINMAGFNGTQYKIIGNSTTRFTGTFDGNGHKISNLTYMTTASVDYVGIFGYIADATIKNLGIENINISTEGGEYAGGLIGCGFGTITNCYSTGEIVSIASSYSYVGGLIGFQNSCSITNCYSTISVTSSSSSTSSVSAYAGGLVGYQKYGSITNCYSTGSVTSSTPSYSYAGGLVGRQNNSTSARIEKCYSTGAVFVSGSTIYKGGLCGYKNGSSSVIICCYFLDRAGLNNGCGEPLTDELMKQQGSFADWNFENVWKICDGMNYPRLQWQELLSGDFVCPYGVDFADFAVLAEQWMLGELSYDISPDDGDGIVDFFDFAEFANSWQGDNNQLSGFTSQWLARGQYNADIAPESGDGIVDYQDLATFAKNWLKED
jgi:hypothetical protein